MFRPLLLAAALLAACHGSKVAPPVAHDGGSLLLGAEIQAPAPHDPGSGPLEFIPQRLDDIYPWLLVRRSMAQRDKAHLWQRDLAGRWVRWTGRVQSITPNGITLKHYSTTTTFDVSLFLEATQLATLRRLGIHRGQSVTYIGRLDAFDDIVRSLQLTHGAIVGPVDAGPPPPLPVAPSAPPVSTQSLTDGARPVAAPFTP